MPDKNESQKVPESGKRKTVQSGEALNEGNQYKMPSKPDSSLNRSIKTDSTGKDFSESDSSATARFIPRIGISIGDTNGVGPELCAHILSLESITNLCTPIVYASLQVMKRAFKLAGLAEMHFQIVTDGAKAIHGRVNLVQVLAPELVVLPGTRTPESGKAAYQSLVRAVADARAGALDGLLTAPINKANMPAEFRAAGHTDYLAREFGTPTLMVMASETMRVALVTDHIPLSRVAGRANKEAVEARLEMLIDTLRNDFGCLRPKIALLGLNPHAGEEGKLGEEENQYLKPLVEKYEANMNATLLGPFPADGFFGRHLYSKFDGVLAMYHDQGLIPFKALCGQDGVNFTAGLPIPRTSPAHGTAMDIAGKNLAETDSMQAALMLAITIARLHSQLKR
jgi:4-hydroxythreonine-4-phosphate dehydrogenase